MAAPLFTGQKSSNLIVYCMCHYRDQTWFFMHLPSPGPLEVLKTEAEDRGFQHLPRDLANVNALKKQVCFLLLHKN